LPQYRQEVWLFSWLASHKAVRAAPYHAQAWLIRPNEVRSQWLPGVIPEPPDSSFNVYALTVRDRDSCAIEHMQRLLRVVDGKDGHLTFAFWRAVEGA